MQILVFGATEVGFMIASRMHKHHDIIVIDDVASVSEKFQGLDITLISGSAADVGALEQVNLSKVNFFVACSHLDEANIVACWTVKKMADIETVCFVSKVEIFNTLRDGSTHRYQTKYDIDTVIWPEQLLTQDIFRIILVPEAVDVEYFDDGRIKLFEYPIREDSPLCTRVISEYNIPKNVLIVGIYRANVLFIPSGATRIEEGDRVIFMGTGPALDMLAADIFPQTNRVRTATIIGGGSVGYILARQLESNNIKVKVLEYDEARCRYLADKLDKALVLQADGTDIALLEEESIGSMDVVICVTNNDEKNLFCSLLVKQLGAGRVVTRVGNVRNASLFERVGIDVVVSPWESALKELYNQFQVKGQDVLTLIEWGKGEVVKVEVPAQFPSTRVMDLKFPAEAIIALIRRRRRYLVPNGSTLICANDHLNVFTMTENKDSVQAVFKV